MILEKIKNYFHFTRGERNALLIIISVFFIVLLLRAVTMFFYPSKMADQEIFKNEINEFLSFLEIDYIDTDTQIYKNYQSFETIETYKINEFSEIEPDFFEFDPNSIELNDILRLGINRQVAQIWINFRNSGGQFLVPQDLLRIYGMDDATFNSLEPYINIKNDNLQFSELSKNDSQLHDKLIIELNTTDTSSLKKIPGIGSYFANAIINYRQQLGGFYHKSQLLEIYLFDSLKLEEIKEYIYIDPNAIVKKDINSIENSKLMSHPYINRTQANMITNYRKQHGKFSDINDLLKIYTIDSVFLSSIKAYFYAEKGEIIK